MISFNKNIYNQYRHDLYIFCKGNNYFTYLQKFSVFLLTFSQGNI